MRRSPLEVARDWAIIGAVVVALASACTPTQARLDESVPPASVVRDMGNGDRCYYSRVYGGWAVSCVRAAP